jgi:hypothetical protein
MSKFLYYSDNFVKDRIHKEAKTRPDKRQNFLSEKHTITHCNYYKYHYSPCVRTY